MEDKNYRYTDLTGPAHIEEERGFTFVRLFDTDVNPNGKLLKFDTPLNSDPAANPQPGGSIERRVNIMAGLNKEWFDYHTQKDGFRFRTEDGGIARTWEDLEIPKEEDKDTMDPIKP